MHASPSLRYGFAPGSSELDTMSHYCLAKSPSTRIELQLRTFHEKSRSVPGLICGRWDMVLQAMV